VVRPARGVPGKDFSVEEVRGTFPEETEVKPLGRPADATVRVPGSKSITNRALIVAALADGDSEIENPLFSDDSYWLMDALVRLGFRVEADLEAGFVAVGGKGGEIPGRGIEVFVGNAGTAARFLPPALALGKGPYTVDGVPRMRERPIADLVGGMRELGAEVRYAGEEGRFPLVVEGGGIRGGEARVRGTESSQFLSGLLMAAPYARKTVTLRVEGALVSQPYVGITAGVMGAFGAEVEEEDGSFTVPGGVYRARRYAVEPDASGASYFFAAAALTGGRVRVPGLGVRSSQGDVGFVEVLGRMGCEVEVGEDFVEVRGPEGGRLSGVEVDMNEISDTMITLSAIAPFAAGSTSITNIAHTRHQETDRIAAVANELSRLGVRVEERPDGLTITPGPVEPNLVRTYGDHRIAMAFALVGLVVPGIRIQDPSCVTKTLPEYFDLLRSL
jgi:3-phosphoshikimate 1-carboxyvinyltransferase